MSRILLGVTGSVAAYKSLELLRQAMKAGHSVRVIQTPASLKFVGRSSFEAISGAPVLVDQFERDPMRGSYPGEELPDHEAISHLELVERADVFVVAPATANTLAKMAAGTSDSLLTDAYLACVAPVLIAPAMNSRMWKHSATKQNIAVLRERGVHVVEPESGALASRGEWGVGRYPEVSKLLMAIESVAEVGAPRSMDGLKVLVTAGGTREPIDSVRYLGNRSSGKMGYALAGEAYRRGADVTVLTANVSLHRQPGVRYREASTSAEMHKLALAEFEECDLVLMAAAVADYEPEEFKEGKISKDSGAFSLRLKNTADILKDLAKKRGGNQTIIGFAAEHGADGFERAERKLHRKGVDAVVASDISREDVGFGADDAQVAIIDKGGRHELPKMSKQESAAAILDHVEKIRSRTNESEIRKI